MLLGVAAIVLLPREEEPQIKVPMIDVMVSMPGSSAKEVEERVTRPMEKLLWEIPGVEYIYSTSRDGESLVIVRFKVGEDLERSLVKLTEKLRSNFDRIPHGVSLAADQARSPSMTCRSWRSPFTARATIISRCGGSSRRWMTRSNKCRWWPRPRSSAARGAQVRVLLDPARLASRNLSPAGLVPMLQQANRQYRAGGLTSDNRRCSWKPARFCKSAEDVGNVVVGVFGGQPGLSARSGGDRGWRGGARASMCSSERAAAARSKNPPSPSASPSAPAPMPSPWPTRCCARWRLLKGTIIPADVTVSRHPQLRRDGGGEIQRTAPAHGHRRRSACRCSIWLTLGWRESGIVAVAIPATLALTLLVFYLYGFTLNRITLFALIFCIGILVDDAIVVVENIVRHFHLPQNKGRDWCGHRGGGGERSGQSDHPGHLCGDRRGAADGLCRRPDGALHAADSDRRERGDVLVAAHRLHRHAVGVDPHPAAGAKISAARRRRGRRTAGDRAHLHSEHEEDFFTRLYRRVMGPLIHHARLALGCFWRASRVLLLAAMASVGIGWVKVKMLPFDNKSEFQIILNMPEGSSLERTAQAAREMAAAVRAEPEVTDYQIYAGVASPFNFNGLVRHYFMRRGANVADIQVNLVPKDERKAQSHDIAKRVRPRVAAIAAQYRRARGGRRGAARPAGAANPRRRNLRARRGDPARAGATRCSDIFKDTPGVVDVDWYVEADQPKDRFVIDKEKAALHGISAETISQTLRIAVGGESVDLLHLPREKEDVNIVLELPRRQPHDARRNCWRLRVRSGDANALPEPGAPPACRRWCRCANW